MKRVFCLLTVLFLLLCAGCSQVQSDIDPDTIRRNGAVIYEPRFYHTDEELFDASTHIFEGKITDIRAEVINEKTGKAQTSPIGSADPKDYNITTIYTVEVTHSYKGNNKIVEQIMCPGGNWDELIVEQAEVMRRAGLYNEEENRYLCLDFRDMSPKRDLEKGTVYLFCVGDMQDFRDDLDWANDYRIVTNIFQFAYEKDSNIYNSLKEQLPYAPHRALIFTAAAVVVLGAMLLVRYKLKKKSDQQD